MTLDQHQEMKDDGTIIPPAPKPVAIDIGRFLTKEIIAPRLIVDPILREKGALMFHGARGVGKTHISVGLSWAIATATNFLRWSVNEPARVLFFDGEMPEAALQERFRERAASSDGLQPPDPSFLKLVAADFLEFGLPDLSIEKNQNEFYAREIAAAQPDVIVIDNISTICPGLKENEAESWTPMQNWVLAQRRAGRSVAFYHHSGKSGQQRGTSRKEDILDTVVGIRKPFDYRPEDGARFEVHYEKHRGFYGADASPFEAWRVNDIWTCNEIKASDNIDALIQMKSGGASLRSIAERTGLSKSTVDRKLKGMAT